MLHFISALAGKALLSGTGTLVLLSMVSTGIYAEYGGGDATLQKIQEKTHDATVNIFCEFTEGGFVTASGVIIDESGVILTNAHVAQYFLFRGYDSVNSVDCVIRKGSPAKTAYEAELLYLPPTWIEENKKPLEYISGEHDYALLRITGSAVADETLPETFPTLSPLLQGQDSITLGASVATASYPAEFAQAAAVRSGLKIASGDTQINQLYSFDYGKVQTLDFFSVGGVASAQEGSSGGAVVSAQDGHLLGIIVTRTKAATTEERELHVLTLAHINESIQRHTGEELYDFISGNTAQKAAAFAKNTAPLLEARLLGII